MDLKSAGKNIMVNGKVIAVTTGGALLSRKFLDFNVMFKAQPADSALRKHQGIIKLLLALGIAGNVKNDTVKQLLNGVAIEGAIQAVRAYGGGTFFQPLGAGDEAFMAGAADDFLQGLIDGADESLLGPGVANQYPASVAGNFNDFTANAMSAVSGMAGEDDMGANAETFQW